MSRTLLKARVTEISHNQQISLMSQILSNNCLSHQG